MSLTKEEILDGLYNAGLITLGAVGVSMASQEILKDDLGVTRSSQRTLRLVAAVGGGSLLVKFLQKKEYVSAEPFKATQIKKMASVVPSGLFNAVAFAGAGYVFHKLDKKGYEDEMKRHKEKWYEKTVEIKNKVSLLRQRLNDANKDLDDTNEALHNLRMAMDENVGPEPTLNDYYEPSNDMKMYTNVVVGVAGIGSGSFSKQNVIVIS